MPEVQWIGDGMISISQLTRMKSKKKKKKNKQNFAISFILTTTTTRIRRIQFCVLVGPKYRVESP